MTNKSTNKSKRLSEIKTHLTPKEWAIIKVDEMRQYASITDYVDETMNDQEEAIDALERQADERHSKDNPKEVHAFNQLNKKLWMDFVTLMKLAMSVNLKIHQTAEKIGLQAAHKLSTLHTLILQDAFGRTARKAALWVKEYKAADKDEEENRQLMLKELAAFSDVDFGERFSDSLPIGPNLRLRFPSIIEEWVKGTVALIADVFAHQAAVKMIQDKHFDGHAFLFKDSEAGLDKTIKTIQDGVETFNEYLQTRAELFKAEWDDEEKEDGITSAIPGEREGLLTIKMDAIKGQAAGRAEVLVEGWVKQSRVDAMLQAANPEEAKTIARQYYRDVSGMKS